jgi:ATP synthase protein I
VGNKKDTNQISKDIDVRISDLKARTKPRKGHAEGRFIGATSGLRMGTDFLSGVIIGSIFGYFIDEFFATKPFGLVVFLLIGGVAGALNVYRYAKEREAQIKKDELNHRDV